MTKIPSLFLRNHDGDRLVRNEVTPGCEWVLNGEGVATRKWDGTACLVKAGVLYKRFDVKKGRTPPGFTPAQEADPVTGHWPGWLPVGDGPDDQWHREAWKNSNAIFSDPDGRLDDGTYELVGPKINGNSEKFGGHMFVRHGEHLVMFNSAPRDFATLKALLSNAPIEGIVWHHRDGRMAKIKRKDFGLPWPV